MKNVYLYKTKKDENYVQTRKILNGTCVVLGRATNTSDNDEPSGKKLTAKSPVKREREKERKKNITTRETTNNVELYYVLKLS